MPEASASDLFFAITTDRRVRQQAWAQAERKAAQGGAPVWLYELDWATPVDGGKWGSPHSLDLAFVFDNVAKSEAMVGTGPAPQKLADQMSRSLGRLRSVGQPDDGRGAEMAALHDGRAGDDGVRYDAARGERFPRGRTDAAGVPAPLPGQPLEFGGEARQFSAWHGTQDF